MYLSESLRVAKALERIADALERAFPEEKHVDITRFMEGNPLTTSYKYGQQED